MRKIVQQLRGNESQELKEVIMQQKQMLEANQKLMTQLGRNVMKSQQGTTTTKPSGEGNKKPMYEEWQTQKQGNSIQQKGNTWL